MKKKRVPYLFVLLLLAWSFLTTGCWDRREIEDLGITIGMSIDTAKHAPSKEEKQIPHHHKKLIPLSLTYQIVNPKVIGGTRRSSSSKQKPYINITSTGETAFQVLRETSTRAGRPPFFMHLKMIVLGDDVSRKMDLSQLLNLYLRDTEMRRTVNLAIIKGSGRDVLEAKTKNEDLPSFEFMQLVNNMAKTIHICRPITVGEVSEKIATDTSFLIPRVVVHKQEIKLAGAAVISGKTGKMLGWLGEEETAGINLILGAGKTAETRPGGIIESSIDGDNAPFSFEIGKVHSKIIPSLKNGRISFTVQIKVEGRIGEDWNMHENSFSEAYVQKVNQAVAKEVKRLVLDSLDKTQKGYRADVAGFGKRLHIQYPETWRKVKDNWDEQFSQVPVKVAVSVKTADFSLKGKKK
ncbi:Ger(x)C family spore germination protein [Brevibacillus ruminantium]|uniref:Ger(X)C family spore germination protein n=1 Tax=Brevibacillus ruminantium TaxID=2950604 RepID=A0ABY4WMR5_9BACL|nr:Ger(x)C family spore germination protein [Brevibacillus ruminantium]USG68056.1 Ger(x)C family spore germination protein [Brevibacillus ruminantium]